MAESAEELHARAVAAAGARRRLRTPPVHTWPLFPWEAIGSHVVPKVLEPPVDAEPPRQGEDPAACDLCHDRGGRPVWSNDRWQVTRPEGPSGLPLVLWLNARAHVDLPGLDEALAAELGVLTVRLARAMEALDNVGRVHVHRWGDAAVHLNAWFVARPARLPQLRGAYALDWDDVLPPGPRDVWLADCAAVGRALAAQDGVAAG